MRTGMPALLAAWLFAAAPVFAQSPPATDAAPASEAPLAGTMDAGQPLDDSKFWMRAEYLGYWVKGAPLPVALVTGDPANPTHELLNSAQSLGFFSGLRFDLGVWFDSYNQFGVEASFFGLERRTQTFSASSDSAGNPTLAFPFTNQTPGAAGDTFMPITTPGVFAGGVTVTSTLQLWGTEANMVAVLLQRQGTGLEITALAGVRYVDLRETLQINTVSSDLLTSPNTVLAQNDSFGTRNQFYGGQLGARVGWQGDRFGFDLTGKIAVGPTHETLIIQGASTQTGPGGVNGTFPGGFFTQSSNIGHYSYNPWTFIPALEMKVYWLVSSQLRLYAGYDFLYWNQVVRPGSQIDHNINLSQSAVFGAGALSGPAYPAPLFNRTDFWAQGFNVGFEFKF